MEIETATTVLLTVAFPWLALAARIWLLGERFERKLGALVEDRRAVAVGLAEQRGEIRQIHAGRAVPNKETRGQQQ